MRAIDSPCEPGTTEGGRDRVGNGTREVSDQLSRQSVPSGPSDGMRRSMTYAILLLIGCASGCQQVERSSRDRLSEADSRRFAIELACCDRRFIGRLTDVTLTDASELILTMDDGGQAQRVAVDYRSAGLDPGFDAFGADLSGMLRVRSLRGREIVVGVKAAYYYRRSAIPHVVSLGEHLCIQLADDAGELLSVIKFLEANNDWRGEALTWETGIWDSYLHCRDFESDEHDLLQVLLKSNEPTRLRRDMIGWLCRNIEQQDEPWVYPWVKLEVGYCDAESVRGLTVLVLEQLMDLPTRTLASRSWGHFEMVHRLWKLESLLAQIPLHDPREAQRRD
ncbi:MAG: hypothetical protein AB7T19_20650 [Planctomycetota bacterium]